MSKDRRSLGLEFPLTKVVLIYPSGASNAVDFPFLCFEHTNIHNNLASKINLPDCLVSSKTCNFHYCQEEMWFSATVDHGISCT